MNLTISPEVAREEARAIEDFLKQRCMILRQTFENTEAARAALEKERDELLTRLDLKPKKKEAT